MRFQDSVNAARRKMSNLTGKKCRPHQEEHCRAEKCIKIMDGEVRNGGGGAGAARKRRAKVRQCRQELSLLKKEYQQRSAEPKPGVAAEIMGQRQSSGMGSSFNAMAASNQQRSRILDAHTQLKESDRLLDDAKRVANETRNLAEATMENVDDQTETLLRAKNTVDETHTMTREAGKLLTSMGRRSFTNKIFLGIIVFVLLTANVLLIYFNWHKIQNNPAPSPPPPSPPPPSPFPGRYLRSSV